MDPRNQEAEDAGNETEHTSELRRSQAEAERMMEILQERGWTVYPEKVPLQGQSGYYCVRTLLNPDGTSSERTHSIRWNMFETPLAPNTVRCQGDPDLLSFVWGHAGHQGFDYFHYTDGDVGFVCYCRGEKGYSLVLRLSTDAEFSPAAIYLLSAYDDAL